MKLFRLVIISLATVAFLSACTKSSQAPQVNPEIASDCDTINFSSLSDTVTIHLFSEYYIEHFMPEKLWLELEDKGSVEVEDPETGKKVVVKTVTLIAKKNLFFEGRDNMIQFRNDGYELNIPIYQEGKHFCDFYSVDDPTLSTPIVPFADSLECGFKGDTTFVALPNEDNVFITLDVQDWVECDQVVLSAYSDPVNVKFTILSENTSTETRICKVYFKNQTETYSKMLVIKQKGAPQPEPEPEE